MIKSKNELYQQSAPSCSSFDTHWDEGLHSNNMYKSYHFSSAITFVINLSADSEMYLQLDTPELTHFSKKTFQLAGTQNLTLSCTLKVSSAGAKLLDPLFILFQVSCRNWFGHFPQSGLKVLHGGGHVHLIPGNVADLLWSEAFDPSPHGHQRCVPTRHTTTICQISLNTVHHIQTFRWEC